MFRNLFSVLIVTFLASFGSTFGLGGEGTLQPGELMVITVEELPPNTTMASYSLGGEIHGLLLQEKPDGTWEGSFAILPSMAGKTIQPLVTAYLENGETERINLPPRRVEMVRPNSRGDGIVAPTNDGGVFFVFDETITFDSVEVETSDGVLRDFEYQNNYFRLPPGVELDQVREVRATSVEGEPLVIRPVTNSVAALF